MRIYIAFMKRNHIIAYCYEKVFSPDFAFMLRFCNGRGAERRQLRGPHD